MRGLPVVAGSLFAVAACAVPAPEAAEPTEATANSIIGGTLSTNAQDATVLVNEAGSPSCSGVLIAPNLVLTARHCVTYYNETSECGAPLRGQLPTSLITISAGVYANPRSPVARAVRFFVPAAQDLCGNDIALVALDNDLKGVTPATVRFSPVAVDDVTTAVGYGTQGSGRRQRGGVKVLAIGPASSGYETTGGQTLMMTVPANELATTESTCYGDSGGPLLDALDQVVAVASRGLDELCVDRPTFWTSVAAHQQLVRDAAAAVGHPLADATLPPPRTTNAATGSSEPAAGEDLDADEDEGADSSAKRPRKQHEPTVASAGCSIGGRPARGSVEPLLGAALLLAACAAARRAGASAEELARRRRGPSCAKTARRSRTSSGGPSSSARISRSAPGRGSPACSAGSRAGRFGLRPLWDDEPRERVVLADDAAREQ